jgi:pimeloyl-ACP methyl ester carboxylesterase
MTINHLPFQSDESVWRYAQLLAPAVQCNFEPWLQRVLTRTLVLHAENDEIVHPDTVRAVVRALPNAELAWISDGGHYAIHKSRELRARILRFLMEFEV